MLIRRLICSKGFNKIFWLKICLTVWVDLDESPFKLISKVCLNADRWKICAQFLDQLSNYQLVFIKKSSSFSFNFENSVQKLEKKGWRYLQVEKLTLSYGEDLFLALFLTINLIFAAQTFSEPEEDLSFEAIFGLEPEQLRFLSKNISLVS